MSGWPKAKRFTMLPPNVHLPDSSIGPQGMMYQTNMKDLRWLVGRVIS